MPSNFVNSITWGTAVPDKTVTVNFVSAGQVRDGETAVGFTNYEKAQFKKAMQLIENVCGLDFVITNTNNADFQLMTVTDSSADFLGYMYTPQDPNAGIGVFNAAFWDRTPGGDLQVGGFGFVTIVHEMLHGLGLAHPHDTGGSSPVMQGVTSEFDDYGTFGMNQGVYTTMSYNTGYQAGGSDPDRGGEWGHEKGPMALDIAVLQSLYGTGGKYQHGNNTYRLPTGNDEGTLWRALWDTGGIDIIRYDGRDDTTIDLRAATLKQNPGAGGYLSHADNVAGGVTIAAGVRIERGIGGQGDDTITGNYLQNLLVGRDGNDNMKGGDNRDRLQGNNGNDRLDGGAGRDDLDGGAGRDRLIGGTDADVLAGKSGNDQMWGGGGDDALRGDTGRDMLNGGAGRDRMYGGGDGDTFVFSRLSDSKTGAFDIIYDFRSGEDQINLRAIDADATRSGNQAFEYIANSRYDDAGQIKVLGGGSVRTVWADTDGDGQSDFRIEVRGVSGGLDVDDFIL